MINAELDLTGFQKALDLAATYSSRTTAEVINSACLDVIIRASREIPKADRTKMEKALIGKIEVSTMTKAGNLRKKPKITRHPSRLVYNIINARRRKAHLPALTGEDMAKAAKKFLTARIRSIGYIAYAGFQKANRAFGGRGFGNKAEVNERSKAAQGYGRRAEPGSLWAEFTNRATEAYKIGGAIVQTILNQKASEIEQHVNQKLQKEFERL